MILASGGLASALSIVVTVAGLAGLLGGGYAFFSVSKQRGLMELYKGEADAEKRRADRIDRDCQATAARLAAVEEANRVLAVQVSGTDEIIKLREMLETQHAEEMGVFTALLNNLAGKDLR